MGAIVPIYVFPAHSASSTSLPQREQLSQTSLYFIRTENASKEPMVSYVGTKASIIEGCSL